MRKVKQVHNAVNSPMGNLVTYRAMPTRSVDHIDPFLFLNHHGPQTYGKNNEGLPFGPHPHRGFETLTFILKGDVVHWDSSGSKSTIKEGGVQWMTAGKGLVHSEVSSKEFKENGGEEEILQLWMNLPAKHKMVEPRYQGLSAEKLTHIQENEKVLIHLISGNWNGETGPAESITDLVMSWMELDAGGKVETEVDTKRNVFFYVTKGKVTVNGEQAEMRQLVEFENTGTEMEIEADEESIVLFGHGEPFNEPIVAQGPFVMNSQKEIMEAYQDFQSGKMGKWEG